MALLCCHCIHRESVWDLIGQSARAGIGRAGYEVGLAYRMDSGSTVKPALIANEYQG